MKLVYYIDSLSEKTGKVVCWFVLILILILCYEVLMRYAFNNPTQWASDISRMLGATIATGGLAYTLQKKSHVRVDVIYTHLSTRGQAIIDVLGTLVLFFPLLLVFIYASISWTVFSWERMETWQMTAWFPITGPIRTIISLALCFFTLQACADFVRYLRQLKKVKRYD